MMNIAAVGGMKSLPLFAECGLSSLFFYLAACLFFLVPVVLISGKLSSQFPKAGGIFAWVSQAFGYRTGLFAISLLWIQNILWLPVTLFFIVIASSYIFFPQYAHHSNFLALMTLGLFWIITLLNILKVRVSRTISTLGTLFGILLPIMIITILGILWMLAGQTIHTNFSFASLIPETIDTKTLVLCSTIMASLVGIEMSAVHADDVKHPQKSYPRALWISAGSTVLLSLLGICALLAVVPLENIRLVGGSIQTFSYFMEVQGWGFLVPLILFLFILGVLGSLNTWVLGPSKGLSAAINTHKSPSKLLILQATLVSVIILTSIYFPLLHHIMWLLPILGVQVYFLMYLLLFATATRIYKNNIKICFISCIGILSTLVALSIGIFFLLDLF